MVRFVWPYPAESVVISGTFNGWNGVPLHPCGSQWYIDIDLRSGQYEYKFIVDHRWCYDIMKPTTDDGYGGYNNVILVIDRPQETQKKAKKSEEQQKESKKPKQKKPKQKKPEEKKPEEKKPEEKKPEQKKPEEKKPEQKKPEQKKPEEKKTEQKKTEKKKPEQNENSKALSPEDTILLRGLKSNQEKRRLLEELLKQKFFYIAAYEIYGGVKGLYDYGPNGSALASNLEKFWRDFFILEENMLQIQTATLTPEIVFKTSGHVDKFEDLMVSDIITGDCFRADHLLEDTIEKLLENESLSESERSEMKAALARADDFSAKELGEQLKKYKAVAPETGNEISDPFPFNLMFSTQIGPTGKSKGYLRPETAQGMFVNFSRLLDFNAERLPFAAAQIGPAFRNEISPRSGLLRVREFILAEIEHFVDPNDKSHPKFPDVAHQVLPLLSREDQISLAPIKYIPIGKAVSEGIVNNETLGYFLVRVYLFLITIGINEKLIRFRQHLSNEMAHYAQDCWDAEIYTTYGWIECVGNADRACFDLTVHQQASGKNLTAFVPFPEGVKDVEALEIEVDKNTIGRTFKGESKAALAYLHANKDDQSVLKRLKKEFDENHSIKVEGITLTAPSISFKTITKRISGYTVNPSVIEPSFGLGRIIYCLLEHSFYVRECAETRFVLSLRPVVAPYKCSILTLVSEEKILGLVPTVVEILKKNRISYKLDTTGSSIGRRYARTDEIGIPFGITIDNDTVQKSAVTVRDRDSMEQIRVDLHKLGDLLRDLVDQEISWSDALHTFPKVVRSDDS